MVKKKYNLAFLAITFIAGALTLFLVSFYAVLGIDNVDRHYIKDSSFELGFWLYLAGVII